MGRFGASGSFLERFPRTAAAFFVVKESAAGVATSVACAPAFLYLQ